MKIKKVLLDSEIELSYIGPDLELGALPSVFYFALSAEETLGLDPYNQPAAFLQQYPMRIFSMTLPGHGEGRPATEAIRHWHHDISQGQDIISAFIQEVRTAVEELERKQLLLPGKLGVLGLSRGAFIAVHAAAKILNFDYILGFAPLTKLTYAREFRNHPHLALAESLNLEYLIPDLLGRHLRFYIGNHDTRVGTALCFDFIQQLANTSFEHKMRSPKVELIIQPSIGHHGHGTSQPTFCEGAGWLGLKVGAIL